MKILIALTLLSILSLPAQTTQQPAYAKLKIDAEKLYAQGSFALARELYEKADAMSLSPAETRWVDFRLADTTWRAEAATETADSTKYVRAQQTLEQLIRDGERDEERDLVWAEAHESLGDFTWARRDSHNWGAASGHYQLALDWWAGERDVERARERYLKIVKTIAKPSSVASDYYYGYYGNYLPTEVIENYLKIATRENDKAHAHYLLATSLRMNASDVEQQNRVAEEFEAALKAGRATEWYDDALYFYGEWLTQYGRVRRADDEGNWVREPDYMKALEIFRRLLREHAKGETRFYDQAKQEIEEIIKATVGVGVTNIFLPDSEIQFYLNWRNVKQIDLTLYKVNIPRDLRFAGPATELGSWLQQIRVADGERVKSWSKETKDTGEHMPGQEVVRLDTRLPVGAYVLEAKGGQETVRDLILVTDASVVLKTTGKQALVYFSNALSGAPIAAANVKLWQRVYVGDVWVWKEFAKQTNGDGLAVFDLGASRSYSEVFASAEQGGRQAFSLSQNYVYNYHLSNQPWRIYAFTDRPAYRPGEEMQWKFIARKYTEGTYSTPANQTVEFEIIDPRGTKVKESKTTLNAFGSAWGALELSEAMPLGEYRIQFFDEGRHRTIGSAQLFRLEEYKLPEFKVSIQTPEENGKKKAFRLGEKVEVKIEADYYYGGAVGGGTVELLVYQNPFYLYWSPTREYPWFYEAASQERYYGGGPGQIVKRETLKLDAEGKTTLTFDTPRGQQQDYEYRIEARVTDASRREIVSNSSVRVTRQRYYVYPRAEHNIYRPQDEVTVDIKTLDANSQPVAVEGKVRVTRDYWYEIWLDPNGREIKGEELRRLRERENSFPYPAVRGANPWRLKFRGYQQDEILVQTVRTDAEGAAQLRFKPESEGYYRVAWRSEDKFAAPIKAETVVWVADNSTADLSYREGGVQIILDKDTFRAGQNAPVLLTVPTNDSYVLFSVEGEDLYSYRLIHMTGTAKLIDLPIEERHVPNIFLNAVMVNDRQIFTDTQQVVVPPVNHFLQVDLKADREQYQPRAEGTLTVTTRDQNGRGVAAEVALGLIDESVFYIQKDYAGDPRQFYYGTKRAQYVQTHSTFQQKAYTQLVENADKQLIDIKNLSVAGLTKEDDTPFSRLQSMVNINRPLSSGVRRDEAASGARESNTIVVDGLEGAITGYGAGTGINGRSTANLAMIAPSAKASADAPPPPPGSPEQQEPAVQVRSDFRSTIMWQPDVVTDRNGTATVKVKYPDSLTGWQATARVASAANQFGIANTATRTKQPLIVRLQAPRFFVAGDEVTVSAVINNNTEQAMRVAPSLNAEGLTVTGVVRDGKAVRGEAPAVDVGANGEMRVDWLVSVRQTGNAKLKVTARGDKYSDAMEKEYVVHEHGIEKFVTKSGKLRGSEVSVKLRIPKERRTETTNLSVQVSPSMAVTMLDALPYLVDYPYGCTEQTMSRFLPAAVTAKTLKDLGLRPEDAMNKIFGGIEREHVRQTQPGGKQDLRQLDAMVKKGLERLYDFQHADGGWGWWKEGESDHFMTAYVVWGFTLAREAGITLKPDALERAVNFLDKEIVEKEIAYDEQAWMLHALSAHHALTKKTKPGEFQAKAFENLWNNRERLNAYTRALLALSAHHYGDAERARVLIQNLENGVKIDSTPDTSIIQRGEQQSHAGVIGTAHWGEDGIYWRWSDGGVEATAFALRALLIIDPKNKLIEPVTNWLVKNRRGAQWSNTRDTAITVLTLNEYLRASGELQPDLEYELLVNGNSITRKKLTAADALSAPSLFTIDRRFVRDGDNEIVIRRQGGSGGDAPVYFAAQAQFYSLEEPIAASGNEIFVRRQYYKLVGRPTLLKGYVYDRQLLNPGDTVRSGERIEAVITIEAKNNFEYLIFEDLKPAGIEAVQLRSGESLYAKELKSGAVERKFGSRDATGAVGAEKRSGGQSSTTVSTPGANDPFTGRSRWVYQELRDRKVALFIDKLPEGVWEIRYDFRAEVPGTFHALPVLGQAMYVPEIRCNDQELRFVVEESR